MDQGVVTGLSRWLGAPQALADHVITHPRFDEAARLLCRKVLAATDADPAFDGVCKDVGRRAVTNWAVGLHLSGGLTLPRLKELCAHSGIVSPGRARAILAYMRFLGYVVPVRDRKGRHAAHYEPTPACLNACRTYHRITFEAASLIEPELASALARVDEQRFVDTFMCKLGLESAEFLKSHEVWTPAWDIVLHRHAGVQVIHALALSAGDSGPYPPAGSLHIPLAELARRFRVSRPHVARLFRDGEKKGVFVRHDGNAISLTAEGRQAYRGMLQLRLFSMIWFAARLMAELGELSLAHRELAGA